MGIVRVSDGEIWGYSGLSGGNSEVSRWNKFFEGLKDGRRSELGGVGGVLYEDRRLGRL